MFQKETAQTRKLRIYIEFRRMEVVFHVSLYRIHYSSNMSLTLKKFKEEFQVVYDRYRLIGRLIGQKRPIIIGRLYRQPTDLIGQLY